VSIQATIKVTFMRTIGIALLAAAFLGAAYSDADEPTPQQGDAPKTDAGKPPQGIACAFVRDWESWKPAPDAKPILLRVSRKRYLRLELATACPTLTWPDARLINVWHGTSSMCDALDWDLKVSLGPPGGFPVPCIVKKVVAVSPEEIAALPKNQRP
jgi:hypothetical protein